MLVVPTFQKGDLAKQQPVYQGRVGEGGQGDGAEPGAKEGLGLRVGRGLAIDCDGQGCEDEERDLGRRELAVASASFANITNTLCSLRGRGPASLWPKKHNFTILRLSASFTNFTVPSPPKQVVLDAGIGAPLVPSPPQFPRSHWSFTFHPDPPHLHFPVQGSVRPGDGLGLTANNILKYKRGVTIVLYTGPHSAALAQPRRPSTA